jgi:hypothetical protein
MTECSALYVSYQLDHADKLPIIMSRPTLLDLKIILANEISAVADFEVILKKI